MNDQVMMLFGLGIFVFVAEKALKESGRGDMAFLVNFGGFIFGLFIVLKLIKSLINLTTSLFPVYPF